MKSEVGWELDDFTRARLDGEIEILMGRESDVALVVWPWWADEDDVNASALRAAQMGYEDILEIGNLEGYSIPEVDCKDWDFMVMGVKFDAVARA
jgi:hypothetical protein